MKRNLSPEKRLNEDCCPRLPGLKSPAARH